MSTSLNNPTNHGILLLDKPKGKTSFHLVGVLRRITRIKTIGHSGTLDPFATGVMVMLIGKPYTRLSSQFLEQDKEYKATLKLGSATDTFDCEGKEVFSSDYIPSLSEVETVIGQFQGSLMQTPPMFSAKKIGGQKLYELARKGVTVEREARPVTLQTTLLSYQYPFLDIQVACSKGTYVRSIAEDMGKLLQCGAHLSTLIRTRSGKFHIDECTHYEQLCEPSFDLKKALRKAL